MTNVSKPITVKNHRLKISPEGIITLPVAARKALQMKKDEGHRVTVSIENGAVVLSPTSKTGGFRVSPKGQLQLRGDAREILLDGKNNHYWMELYDGSSSVNLKPFK
jgi:bifunctional DNA-binding transcriptional regulator/antitoxin component of YhaV-PrlF toxin-antitoxin module